MANQSLKITINQPPADEDQHNEYENNNYKMNNGVVQHNQQQDDKKQGFVQEFRNSVEQIPGYTQLKDSKGDLIKNSQENIMQAQEQMDQSKAEQNAKNKKKLMLKSVAQFQKISNLKNSNDQNTLKTNFLSKIRNIVTKMKVAPQKKMTRDEIIKKYQKAYMIIKTVVRLNKISENIRNYGTSSNLFDVATRDRPTVKKVLFPLTAVTEEEEEQELSEALQFPLIQPNSIVNKIWNPIYMILMIYTATIMPYRISFEDEIQTGWSVVDYITDSLFWIDMFINMFTAYYNEDGQLVKNRKAVMCNYLKTWFIIDFLACFPFEILLKEMLNSEKNQAGTIKLVKLIRLPRMYRLVRITKVVKLFKFFDRNQFLDFLQFNTGIIRLISLFMTVLLIVHLMGCLWFYIAKLNDFDSNTWVARNDMENDSSFQLYIASIYYTFTALTTVGYGDITAKTNIEMIVTMFWMVFGVGFYSFTIGILSSVLAHMDTKSTNLQKKISIMNEFCNEMKICKDLKQKIRKSLTYNSDRNCFSWADQQNIFRQLPINLRYEICMNIHGGIMRTFNFLTMEDDKYFVTRIVPILKPLHMEEGEILWQEGWNPESIFLLASGRINFMSKTNNNEDEEFNFNSSKYINKVPIQNKSVRFKSMINGSYFGEIDILKNRKRQFNAQCDSECELYYLPRFDYENVVKRDFPHIDEKIRQIADERDIKNEEALQAIKRILKDPKNQTEEQINEKLRQESAQKSIIQKFQQFNNKKDNNKKRPFQKSNSNYMSISKKHEKLVQRRLQKKNTKLQEIQQQSQQKQNTRSSLSSKNQEKQFQIQQQDENNQDLICNFQTEQRDENNKVNEKKIKQQNQNQNQKFINLNQSGNDIEDNDIDSSSSDSEISSDSLSQIESESDDILSSDSSDSDNLKGGNMRNSKQKYSLNQARKSVHKQNEKIKNLEVSFALLEKNLDTTLSQLKKINKN